MNDMHLQIEKTFFELAKGEGKNCLVLCDRGIMDLSACKCYDHHVLPLRATLYVTGPTNIDHVNANYTELYFR